MSRSVPIEDPLLHPPTPPIQAEQTEQKQDRTEQPRSSLQFDDGPIPFQTTSSTEATAKNTSIFAPIQAQPLSKPNTVPVKASAVGNASETEAASLPKFVDPLTAAALEQNIEGTGSIESTVNKAATTETTTMNTSIASVPSSPSTQGSAPLPNISIPTGHNNIPTEYPTHLASPPLPQRPSSRGGTPFAAFQSFSSALQPPSASEAPVSTDLSSGLGSIVGGSIGLSFKESQQGDEAKDKARNDTSTTTAAQQQQRAKQNPIGISTANIAGTGIGSIQDQSDMVHQELRSPEQQHHALEQQQEQQQQQHQQQQPQHRTERNSQMTIKLVEQGREQYVG
ncbi:hypothetical protein BCR41DRAFT_200529 [Lobosporangium transversale]|uniref:Uncharacterized protein n=1 Tax=Lobosporangium transversale TaxID=64571 RepID=A0A1Y2G8I0_9FUNG|nr:hypothetical protein BCR41DRAFT_200529 [Lobosporangium transversale]ORZ04197.1 hypothetical protein BCR41DRAFT_200529 [Lobosporangium transversale]|eukprot:XP_021876411.1 hypothetical protein BCR41DRAFT_200529 [Lobosporangium transversale]